MAVKTAKVDRHDGARKGGAGRQGDAKCNRAVAEPPYHPLVLADTVSRKAGRRTAAGAILTRFEVLLSHSLPVSPNPGLLGNPVSPSFLSLVVVVVVFFLLFPRERVWTDDVLLSSCENRLLARPLADWHLLNKVRVTPRGGFSRKVPRPERSPLRCVGRVCVCVYVYAYVRVCITRGSPPTSFVCPFAESFCFSFSLPSLSWFAEPYPIVALSAQLPLASSYTRKKREILPLAVARDSGCATTLRTHVYVCYARLDRGLSGPYRRTLVLRWSPRAGEKL